MWYGLSCNGTLIAVRWFERRPLIFDFHMGYDSEYEYKVHEVSVIITGTCPEVE